MQHGRAACVETDATESRKWDVKTGEEGIPNLMLGIGPLRGRWALGPVQDRVLGRG